MSVKPFTKREKAPIIATTKNLLWNLFKKPWGICFQNLKTLFLILKLLSEESDTFEFILAEAKTQFLLYIFQATYDEALLPDEVNDLLDFTKEELPYHHQALIEDWNGTYMDNIVIHYRIKYLINVSRYSQAYAIASITSEDSLTVVALAHLGRFDYIMNHYITKEKLPRMKFIENFYSAFKSQFSSDFDLKYLTYLYVKKRETDIGL